MTEFHGKNLPTVWVALPVFNRQENLPGFLECIRAQNYQKIKVVICDDASSDGTAAYLRQHHPEVVLLEGTGNLWWTGGINRCVAYVLEHAAADDLVLTINDDVSLAPDYIRQKVERAQELPGCIIGSVCVYEDNPDKIETTGLIVPKGGVMPRPLVAHGSSLAALRFDGLKSATHLPGKGVLVPIAVYRQVGLYDQEHFPHYHADSEFTYRAHKAGIRVYVDFSSKVCSSVNRSNAGVASASLSWRKILHSFTSPYGLNSVHTYWNLARIHFPNQRLRYLCTTYSRILGGILIRRVRNLFAYHQKDENA